MKIHGLAALAVSVVFVTSCTGPTPDLPKPPSVPRFAVPPPPGADDIASQSFASPLSAADAEQILLRTEIFGWSGANRQIQAYNVLRDQPDALARFRSLESRARWAGQLYALCGLFALEPEAAEKEASRLKGVQDKVIAIESDVVWTKTVAQLVDLLGERKLCVDFRRLKGEANRRFNKGD